MRSKKTTSVTAILDYANKQLGRTDDFATREFKTGISCMIERTLLDTNNYHGFTFLNNDATQEETNCDGAEFYNRFYHTHPKLKS